MDSKRFLNLINECEHKDEWKELASELCGSYHGLQYWDKDSGLLAELADMGYVIKSEDGYGGEGKGDSYWGVFSVKFASEVTFFKISGWYASYEGSHIDPYDLDEVEKVEVTKYEWIKK